MTRCFHGSVWQNNVDKKPASQMVQKSETHAQQTVPTKKILLQQKRSGTGSIRGAHLSNTHHPGDRERAAPAEPSLPARDSSACSQLTHRAASLWLLKQTPPREEHGQSEEDWETWSD